MPPTTPSSEKPSDDSISDARPDASSSSDTSPAHCPDQPSTDNAPEDNSGEFTQTAFLCPQCGAELIVDDPQALETRCPNCQCLISLSGTVEESPAEEDAPFVIDDEPDNETPEESEARRQKLQAAREAELDANRIHQLSAMRRAGYRTRSYFIIGIGGCVVMAGQLVWMAWNQFHTTGRQSYGLVWAIGYLLFAAASLVLGWILARHAWDLNRQLHESAGQGLPPAPDHPDFNTLSNGSQYADKLHGHIED